MKLKFKDVLSNPYRDLKSNPLLKEKVSELKSSIETTGFWDNVVVRKNKAGKYELAYGHHRVAAAIEAGLVEADFIVKDLTDALMIQIMDNENREVYASSPASLIESVKAVVNALAEGFIPPFEFELEGKTRPDGMSYGMRTDTIRYAPSYVPNPTSEVLDPRMRYTALHIARFLGRTYANPSSSAGEQASRPIMGAINFLHLEELGAVNKSVLIKDKKPISASKLFEITTDIKKRTEIVQERRGKSAEEIAKLREEQLEAQKKAKADSDKAEAEHKALVKKLADAQREENDRKADALKAEIKAKDERAKAKEVLNNLRRSEFDAQIQAKKDWEASQRIQDAYAPIRRDVEAMIGKLETLVSERNPFREDVKSLSTRKGITDVDKQRIRRALMDVSNWYADYAAPQFAPEMKAAQKRAVVARKATESRPKGKGGA
jgi:hypothetical protein